MKRLLLLSTLALAIIGCNNVTVDFTYSPTQPKAGEQITFTNSSSAGENWQWDFGDNGKSLLKSPVKIYKKPGTYIVTLQVDSSKNKTCSQSVTVYDSIPTFVSSSDSITHMTDVTLTANIYNPFSYTLSYTWDLPSECVLVSGELSDNAITVYFNAYNDSSRIHLTIHQGSKVFEISKSLYIYESMGPSTLFQTADGTRYRQRLISSRFEDESQHLSAGDLKILQSANDTAVTFNQRHFVASQMHDVIGMSAQHIAIDALAQKWYITNANGLFVTNINGEYPQCIDPAATGALCVDQAHKIILYATINGLYMMPLVKSSTNLFSTSPVIVNTKSPIVLITLNPEAE